MSNKKNAITSLEQLKKYQIAAKKDQDNQDAPISELLDSFEAWFIENWKKAIMGCCALAVAATVGILIGYAYRAHDAKIMNQFANATDVKSLQEVLAEHASYKAADAARFKLAALLVDESKYDEARAQLLSIVNSGKSELFMKGHAAINAAYLLEKTGKEEDAAAEFASIYSNQEIQEELRAEAAYAALRLYSKLNQVVKANNAAAAINLTRADSEPDTPYGYWAVRAKKIVDSMKTAIETPATAAK